MKHLLLTTIAAVVLVGCGLSLSEFKDSQLRSAIKAGSIEDVKKAIANGANVNAMAFRSYGALVRAPLDQAAGGGRKDIVQLLIAKVRMLIRRLMKVALLCIVRLLMNTKILQNC